MASRLQLATTAVRPKMYARMMLSGPPGAGKTDTALTVAKELVFGDLSKVIVIDTEKDSALTYADKHPGFVHLPWDPPYSPKELGTTVIEAGKRDGIEVVIVDSLTHFWRKEGGVMSIADGKFGGWKAARPIQEQMVDALLGAQAHVIVCVRSKIEYAQMEDEQRRGRQKVVKMGMAPQQDGDLEYEMNIAAEMDMEHAIAISKSRTTDIPVNRTFAPGAAAELGAAYADWLRGGIEIETLSNEALNTRLGTIHPDVRAKLQRLWAERGLPGVFELNPSQILRVVNLLDQVEQDYNEYLAAQGQQPQPTAQPEQPAQQPQEPAQQPQQQPQAQAPQQQQPAPQNGTQQMQQDDPWGPPQGQQPQQDWAQAQAPVQQPRTAQDYAQIAAQGGQQQGGEQPMYADPAIDVASQYYN